MEGKTKDRERIEKMVSPARNALNKANISVQPFNQLLKKYSKGSCNTRVTNRNDSWILMEYILQKSKHKHDVRKREYTKSKEDEKDIIMTYYAFMDEDLMHEIAKNNFQCVPLYEKLHDIQDFCKEWDNLVNNTHQKQIESIFPDASIPEISSFIWIDDDEQIEDQQTSFNW